MVYFSSSISKKKKGIKAIKHEVFRKKGDTHLKKTKNEKVETMTTSIENDLGSMKTYYLRLKNPFNSSLSAY